MFSGLTSQVSSWIGKKGEGEISKPEEEQTLSSPVTDNSVGGLEPEKKDASPTKAGGVLGNVKTQMTSWLGSASIPTFRRADGSEPQDPTVQSPASDKSVKGPSLEKDEDDNSSATGGADSDAGDIGEEGEALDEKDPQAFGAVSTKAFQGAKTIGNFLYTAVNTAGKKVTETTAKIKKTVEENNILGEFNKEQEAFIKEKQGKDGEAAVPPWVGYHNQDSLKEECLVLSQDKRNFVRSPPAGVDFNFDFESSYPVALATLAEDPNLESMRFALVPKVVSEENFWRNYFYRVSLICQASELNSMAQEGSALEPRTSTEPAAQAFNTNPEEPKYSPESEFVSDNFRPSSQDLQEVREGMKKLGLDPPPVKEEDWEKELEDELKDFEVVADGDKKGVEAHWENEIEQMLESEALK